MRSVKTLALVLSALAATGCTFHVNTISHAGLGDLQFAPLGPDQYEILSEVKGSGKATYFLWFEVNNQIQYSGEIVGHASSWWLNSAYRKAHYAAIKSVPGADMLIAPRYEVETWGAPALLNTTTVTVYAKAIRLRSGGASAPASQPGAPSP
ncbi:MAG: hypothetical protein VKS61_09370 [Candidatus Sericytochromatia bacterium]|nr:hypothetical protein [Candidatus Sericytochromatia bacterium]